MTVKKKHTDIKPCNMRLPNFPVAYRAETRQPLLARSHSSGGVLAHKYPSDPLPALKHNPQAFLKVWHQLHTGDQS